MLRATDSGNIPGFNGLRRNAETTACYAEAVRQIGKERGIAVCDVWSAMMRRAGWKEGWCGPLPGCEEAPENGVLRGFLSDGKRSEQTSLLSLARRLHVGCEVDKEGY